MRLHHRVSRIVLMVLSSRSLKAQQLFQFFIYLTLKHLSNRFRNETNRATSNDDPHTLYVIKLNSIDAVEKRNGHRTILLVRDNYAPRKLISIQSAANLREQRGMFLSRVRSRAT